MEQQNKPVRKTIEVDIVSNTYKPVSNHQHIVSSQKFSTLVLSNVLMCFEIELKKQTYFWILGGELKGCMHKLNNL